MRAGKRIDAAALAELGSMQLRARAIVEGHYSGQHRSPYRGASIEFADHRPYSHGDELRHLDWRLYGRSDRFFIKEYDAETNLTVHVLLDTSGSMDFPPTGVAKLTCGSYLAAAIAWLAHRQRDAVSLTCFDENISTHLPPSTRRGHLQQVFDTLENLRPGGDTDLPGVIERVSALAKRRGLVVLISDLLAAAGPVLRALAHLRHRGHDVIVFQVLSPEELSFDYRGPLLMEDVETGRRLATEAGEVRADYLAALRAHLAELGDGCRRHHMDYELFRTDGDFARALTSYLSRRTRSLNRMR
ncbi:MAG: DUF58 domain-containing protein [Armatimonadetes bacterium]|nr:DUF58 domain-containing protein [Armatimonadota bacterium]